MKNLMQDDTWEEGGILLDPAFEERDRLRKAGKPVEIARTERLLIRETVLSDVPRLYEIFHEAGAGDWMEPLQPTLQEEMEFMEAYIRYAYAFYDFGLWTVLESASGEIVGRAGLFPSKVLDEAVELGYLIAPGRQRRGYAAECGRAILSYAFEVLDLKEIHIRTDCRNLASVRTAERLGFTEQGRFPDGPREWIHFKYEIS